MTLRSIINIRAYDEEYLEKFYKHVEPETGRRYSLGGHKPHPGERAKLKEILFYEFLGIERYWRFSKEEMQRLYKAGVIVQTKPGAVPSPKSVT